MKMNGNRILTLCLAISLVVHAIFAFVFRPLPRVDAKPEQQPQQVRITEIHTPPPPTPTPEPTKPPQATPQKPQPQVATQPAVHPPRTVDTGRTPSDKPNDSYHVGTDVLIGTPAGPTGSPEPTPTPKPACSNPNVAATTIDVVPPTIPESAGQVDDAQAQVRVTLEATGAIHGVEIYRPSGNPSLDREALRVARLSTYRAEIRNCVAVAGDYLFTVDFKE